MFSILKSVFCTFSFFSVVILNASQVAHSHEVGAHRITIPQDQAAECTLEAMPEDIKVLILNFLVTAPGASPKEELHAAAKNIWHFMTLSKKFEYLLYDGVIARSIVRDLARRYSTEWLQVALALRNPAVADIIRSETESKLHYGLDKAIGEQNVSGVAFLLKLFPGLVKGEGHSHLHLAVEEGHQLC